jgi:hypothetical protein
MQSLQEEIHVDASHFGLGKRQHQVPALQEQEGRAAGDSFFRGHLEEELGAKIFADRPRGELCSSIPAIH